MKKKVNAAQRRCARVSYLYPSTMKFPFALPVLLLSLFTRFELCAQQEHIDSLKKVTNSSAADSSRAKAFNALSWIYKDFGAFDTALIFVNNAMELATRSDYKKGMYSAYNNRGSIHLYQGNYPEALKNYLTCLQIQEQIQPNGRPVAPPKSIATSYSNIGNVYYLQHNYEMALKYQNKSMMLREKSNDKLGLANSHNNIGLVYDGMRNYTEAMSHYRQCLALYKEVNYEHGMTACYNNIGTIYGVWKQHERAIEFFMQSEKIAKKNGDLPTLGQTFGNLGTSYAHLKQYDKAISYLKRTWQIGREIGDLETSREASENLSEVYELTGDHRKALEFYKIYVQVRDSLFNEDNTRKTVQMEMQYEFDKKNAAAKLEQEKKDAIATAEKRRQKIILMAVSLFGLLILAFAVFAYRSFLQKKRANEAITHQKQIIEEKQREILDSIYYARRIQRSLLTSETYIQRQLATMKNRL